MDFTIRGMELAVAGAAVGAEVLVEKLVSYSAEEIGRMWNFNEDLEKLKKSLLMIQDFLEEAQTKQVTNKPVQRWLMKLEDVAFDADYVFDQLNYRLIRRKMESSVSTFFSTDNPIAFRRNMAQKIKEINDELESINEEAMTLGLQTNIASSHAPGSGTNMLAYMESDSFSVDPVFVGRDDDVEKMVELVISSPTEEVVSVLPIVGMDGLGKTP